MSEIDPRLRPLVEAARAAGPTTEDRARIRTALAGRLALPASGSAPPQAAAGAHPAVAGVGAKVVAAGVLIGATGFGAGLFVGKMIPPADLARHGLDMNALRRAHAAERMAEGAPVAAVVPVVPVGPAAVAPPVPPAAPAPVAEREAPHGTPPLAVARRVPAPVPSAAPAVEAAVDPAPRKASSLVEETALLREAQTSLGAGDAAAALARLDELGARHPDGLLREERLAARVVALCAAGRVEEARREAERFLAEAPLSIHAARVRGACTAGRGERRP